MYIVQAENKKGVFFWCSWFGILVFKKENATKHTLQEAMTIQRQLDKYYDTQLVEVE